MAAAEAKNINNIMILETVEPEILNAFDDTGFEKIDLAVGSGVQKP